MTTNQERGKEMTHDQERERFEKWCVAEGCGDLLSRGNDGKYHSTLIYGAWRGWQAAKREPVCSCPSGDGSLRWPCQAHSPSVSDEMLDAACEAYADMYDVEYGVDNRRQCIESALIAALTTPRGG